MKTSTIERTLNSIKRVPERARDHSPVWLPRCIALLLMLSLFWSLFLPFSAHAKVTSRKTNIATNPSIPTSQSTETFTIYGPHRFDRHTGQPVNVVENFSIPTEAIAPFAILVQNGAADGSGRVSSATIRLNGADVFTPKNFNQTVGSLTKSVTLTATNTLEVKLASAPGSFLTVTFTATRQALPPTLASVTPGRATQGQTLNVTFHGSNTHWVAGQTRASLGGEVAVGGSPFAELGSVTVVDALTAVATVTVSPTAALDPRAAKVVTPAQGAVSEESVTLADSFIVDAATPPGASSSNVSTIAGGAGLAGFADGAGAAARFSKLTGVAIGPDDAIYVADSGNQRIRVARSQTGAGSAVTWAVATLAGNGTAGFADGPAASAQFNNPQGVAIDGGGIVYVADTANNRIRRIATDGTVSTLAGDGTAGFQDGPGGQARFNAPQGILPDSLGNIYVADTGNSSLRVINAAGEVRTVAGDGTIGSNDSPNARFDGLVGVAIDGSNIYVYLADTGNHRIRRLDPTGTVITVTGAERGFKDGSASQARFAEPSGIAIDGAGKIIVADAVNSLVRLVDPDLAASGSNQAVATIAGTGGRGLTDGAGNVVRFFTPRGVAVSISSAIIVADTGNQVLRRILLPPSIVSIAPPDARVGDTVTIIGARFDGRAPARNIVRFTRSQQAGGGQTTAVVTQATRTALTVLVPNDAVTGPVTVQTEGGTATSPSDFVVDNFPAPAITDFNPKRGPVGTQVTITGTNLKVNANDPAVTFAGSNGRLPALVSSASATQVQATVPNGAITGLIQLTHAGGTAPTATPFTVDTEQDFQLTVAPAATTAVQGGAANYVIYVTSQQSTFSQLASLTATGLPPGVSPTFNPAQITAGANSTLTLNLSGTLSPGSYAFTIHAVASVSGHDLEHTAGATLNIMAGGQTTLSGRVLSTEQEPIMGATVSLDGRTAMTDAAGAFLLSGVTAGAARPLMVDGRTASAPNRTYPIIIEPASIVAGQANVVPYVFYLPPIDTQYEVEVVPGQNTVATNPRVTGLQMTIPAGANLRNRDGSPVTRVSITPLPIDRTPAPLPANIKTGLVYTSQPGGAITDIPMPVVYPNLLGVDPGTRVELFAFNHDTVQWYIYGYGRVSADGRTIAPEIDPNTGRPYGLRDFSWHYPSAGPGGDPGEDPCAHGANPVDFATGVKIEKTTDIEFGGARGVISLTRVYNSDRSAGAFFGRFGRGTKDNYDVRLTGDWTVGGAGRVVMPDEQTGRLFSYSRTDTDGALVFTTTATVSQIGDVVRKLSDGTFEYRVRDGYVMRFNGQRNLVAVVDRNGNTTSLSYSGSNLTSITDPVGRSITLTYDSSNLISSATDPLGKTWHYTYGSFNIISGGFLASITDPLGHATQYSYTNARLTSIVDARGNVVKGITYNGAGRVTAQQFADGGIQRYDYTLSGSLVSGVKITDALGNIETKRFNAAGYVIGRTDAIDRAIGTNLPVRTSGPCGCTEATRQFDERGNVVVATDRINQSESLEYEPMFNHVTKFVDKLGQIRTFTYDARGNLQTFKNAMNQITGFTFDADGELTAITDPLNHASHLEYDANGNIIKTTDESGKQVTFDYDGLGRRTSLTDGLGRRSSATYDDAGRMITKVDASGGVTHLFYDANSNLTRIVDPLNHSWNLAYDVKNRLTSGTDPLGRVTKFTYDAADRLTSMIAPSGRSARYAYDARGQLVSQLDSLGGEVKYTYDSRKQITTLTNQRGSTITYNYDALGRVTKTIDPLGRVSTMGYNAVGNLTSITDRLGNQTTIAYDALNRPANVTYPDATVTSTYDAGGRLTQVDDTQAGALAWTYDETGRVLTETTSSASVTYSYNPAGQRASMSAANQPQVDYGYDNAGRLQTIVQGTEAFSFGYDQLSRLTSLQRPNGVTTAYNYDEIGRLLRLTHTNGLSQALEDFQYTYNAQGEVESVSNLTDSTLLPAIKNAAPADAANRISAFGAASYSFDSLGRLVSKSDSQGQTNYQWDARNRLTEVRKPNGQTVTYRYDALGRRISRSSNSATANFLYDGIDVVRDVASGSAATIDYLNGLGPDTKLSQKSASTGSMYFLSDHLGSTADLANQAGNVIEHQQYEPYGDGPGSALTRYGYTGRERDSETGLIYYRARWYDPQQGRFISEDPLGNRGGLNLYAYAADSPTNLVDTLGLQNTPPQPAPQPSLLQTLRDYAVTIWYTGVPISVGSTSATTAGPLYGAAQVVPAGTYSATVATATTTATSTTIRVTTEEGIILTERAGTQVITRSPLTATTAGGLEVPGLPEAVGVLQVGPELYNSAKIVDDRNQSVNDALRAAQGDWTPSNHNAGPGIGGMGNGLGGANNGWIPGSGPGGFGPGNGPGGPGGGGPGNGFRFGPGFGSGGPISGPGTGPGGVPCP